MEKEFVPYELAVKLKALGFDEPCFGRYYYKESYPMLNPKSEETELVFEFGQYLKQTEFTILAPTFSQAFRWFREKYEIFGIISSEKDDNYYNTEFFGYSVYKTKVNAPLSIGLDLKENASYEEAELACLDKLIEIVESKSK